MKTACRPVLAGLAVAVALLTASCSFLGLRHQVVKLEGRGVVTIELLPPPTGLAPTYALAWTRTESGQLESAGFQTVGSDGLASFSLLTNHVYSVGAFTDENGDGKYDAGEPMAYMTNVIPVPFGNPSARGKLLKLTLSREHNLPAGTVIAIPRTNASLGNVVNVALGDIVPLDDPRFSPENGSGGMWRPLDFLSGNTLGIYFTEPYDTQRIPVIFVHGMSGTPRDWSYVMAHFYRTRYQLWFYYYPSGMRLERAARALATGLVILHQHYGFSQCCVVAHSMGGLVSAAAIREEPALDGGTNFIAGFVTISTPFGGVQSAASGVKHLRYPVPSWIDMDPGSSFLKALRTRPLPPGTHYDLIYGEKGENDGVVTVASELEPHNLKRASSVTCFPYGHVEILNEPGTVARVLQCLQNDLSKNPEIINGPPGATNITYPK